jgi:shikimate dehydrogenase
MHNAAFEAEGMNAMFVALDVPPEGFEKALQGLHAAGVAGLSVTLPHKSAAFRLSVDRSETADRARAVNALAWTEHGYRGHATDGPGFLEWTRELGVELAGRRVLLLGSGGAAWCVAHALIDRGPVSIDIVGRSAPGATALAASLLSPAGDSKPLAVTAAALSDRARARVRGSWDLLIRALAIDSITDEENAWWGGLGADAVVLDLNYGPRSAPARARAESRRFADGMGLLLHQGAHSFAFWTGRPAPIEAMRKALATT